MPTQSASVVVLDDDKTKVLLMLREDVRVWTVPGGGPEKGETVQQTAIREALEETGMHVEINAKLGEYFRPNMPNGENLTHVFIGHVKGGSLENAGWEAADVQWFDIDALPNRTTAMSRELIEDALQFSGKLLKKTEVSGKVV